MADLQARFIDVQGFLPHMSRAILALGIVQVFGFFFSGLFVFIVVGSRQGKVKGFKIQQRIGDSQRSVGLGSLWQAKKKWKLPEMFKFVRTSIAPDTLTKLHVWGY